MYEAEFLAQSQLTHFVDAGHFNDASVKLDAVEYPGVHIIKGIVTCHKIHMLFLYET